MVRKISQYRSVQPPSIDFSTNTYIYVAEVILVYRRGKGRKKWRKKTRKEEGEISKKRRRYIDFNGRGIVPGSFLERINMIIIVRKD